MHSNLDTVGNDFCQTIHNGIHLLRCHEQIACIWPKDFGNHLIFFLLLQIGKRLVKRRSLFCLPNHFLQNTVHCVIYKRCGIHHSRYANRNHGNPQMCLIQQHPPIADPCARRNAGIAHLNGGVNAVGTARGKGINRNQQGGVQLIHNPLYDFSCFYPRNPHYPRTDGGNRAYSLLDFCRKCAAEVSRHQNFGNYLRAECIGCDVPITKPDYQNTILPFRLCQRANLLCQKPNQLFVTICIIFL